MLGPVVAGTADISTLSNLLAIVSNPDTAKATLVDLAKQSADAQKAMAEAAAAMEETAKAKADLDQAKADFDKLQMARIVEMEFKDNALSNRELAVTRKEEVLAAATAQADQRASSLDKRQSDLDIRESSLNEREAGLVAREAKVTEREANAGVAALAAQDTIKLYNDKLAQLKQLVG